MRRRTYLAGSIGLLGGLAGCSEILGDDGRNLASVTLTSDTAGSPAERIQLE